MDSWFLAAVEKGHAKVPADDPIRKVCLGKLKNIPAQITTVCLVLVQSFLLNYQLVQTHDYSSQWYWFFMGDGVLVVSIVASFILREWRCPCLNKRHKESAQFTKGLPFASIAWFIYAILVAVRVAVIFKFDLHVASDTSNTKITICISAVICAFYTLGHHHYNESLVRRAGILLLIKSFTIDLLDTVDMLDVLYEVEDEKLTVTEVLEDTVLAIVAFNLLRPSVVLFSLFVDHFGSKHKSLTMKIVKACIELLLVNIPLLVIRVYMRFQYGNFMSVFLVKNLIGILFAIMEIYDCVFEKRKHQTEKIEGREEASNAEPQTPDRNGNSHGTADRQRDYKLEESHDNEIGF